MVKHRILFLCRHNSSRSQMAEGLLNHFGAPRFEACSAGTRPTAVHPLAIRALAEIGIDIGGQRAKKVQEFSGRFFQTVVTVCDQAQEECPFFPGAENRLHHGFPDPTAATGDEEERLQVFRATRDAIMSWLSTEFLKES